MEKASKKNLGVEFVYAYGLYMCAVSDSSDDELYSFGSTDYVEMVNKLLNVIDIIGNPHKEEQLFQEILNNEM